MTPQLLTTSEVAAVLRRSTFWVREHAVELGGIKPDGRTSHWLFDADHVAAWVQARRVQPPASQQPRPRRRPGPRTGGSARDFDLIPLRKDRRTA